MVKVKKTRQVKAVDTNKGYQNWLNSFEWNYFVTLTTHYELTLKSARRLVERWHDKMKKHGFEPLLFWVAEHYEMKDGYHIHGLLKLNRDLKKHEYIFITELYQICSGACTTNELTATINNKEKRSKLNWNRIDLQRYLKAKNGGAYCTKYVIKEQRNKLTEYDILI
jgi:hypothetical protein